MDAYEVISPGGRKFICVAKDSRDAKRQACRFWGIRPSDRWCGITALKAKKIKGGVDLYVSWRGLPGHG